MRFPLYWLLRLQSKLDGKTYVVKQQSVSLSRELAPIERILDLGGGGEGIIGRLYGSQVVAVDTRKEELDGTPDGPVKVVADARSLPFEDGSFDCVTAFYFFMYLRATDFEAVLKEGFRVLKPGSAFHIWDVTIPPIGDGRRQLFVVPVKVMLPEATVQTAYGVRWKDRVLSSDALVSMATAIGFEVLARNTQGVSFYLGLRKP